LLGRRQHHPEAESEVNARNTDGIETYMQKQYKYSIISLEAGTRLGIMPIAKF
jgi:hypothetical protein